MTLLPFFLRLFFCALLLLLDSPAAHAAEVVKSMWSTVTLVVTQINN
jgi:hypothetical protein